MKKTSIVVCLFLCSLVWSKVSIVNAGVDDLIWKDVTNGIGDPDLHVVAVSPSDTHRVYASSSNALYGTVDGGISWSEILSFRGSGNIINDIELDAFDGGRVYVGTSDGLFVGTDGGSRWEKRFDGIGELKSDILAVVINPLDPNSILIGTKSGLFWTDDNGKKWERGRNLPTEIAVTSLTRAGANIIYAGTENWVYKSANNGKAWERLYKTALPGGETDISYESEDSEDNEEGNSVNDLVFHQEAGNLIIVATSRGLLLGSDGGITWRMASSLGLGSRDIVDLTINPDDMDHIYAATNRGGYMYSVHTDSWDEIYKGLTTRDIRNVTISQSALWAATKKGLFRTYSSTGNTTDNKNSINTPAVLAMFSDEPTIKEIRDRAISYAEVHPDKINSWRRAALKRAWLPDLHIDYDRSKDWQSSTYFYSTSSQKYTDDDITRGNDDGWSISLTWELGDLIWSSAQTSIDTRSKLMVQLRDDILNEVTRLYFERRRLQIEMVISPSSTVKDEIGRELRIQELTADIDALTGSYLSKRLAQTGAENGVRLDY